MKSTQSRTGRKFTFSSLAVGLGIAISVAGISPANAITTTVDLGAAQSFAVLGHTTVTNTGSSTISGDLGVTTGTAVTGFPPGLMVTGNIHSNDAPAADARLALNTAYLDAAGRTPPDNAVPFTDLSGMSLTEGLYQGGALSNTGILTLDGAGKADSVWIFQASSTLITDPASTVVLTNGADPCNVFWQISDSATLGTNSSMVGTVMALQSISANTGATVDGRLLAYNGAVTLQSNNIAVPATCAGTIAPGGTKTSPAAAPAPAPVTPSLAEAGMDISVYLFAILTLIASGALLLIGRSRSLRRRNPRRSQ